MMDHSKDLNGCNKSRKLMTCMKCDYNISQWTREIILIKRMLGAKRCLYFEKER